MNEDFGVEFSVMSCVEGVDGAEDFEQVKFVVKSDFIKSNFDKIITLPGVLITSCYYNYPGIGELPSWDEFISDNENNLLKYL